MNVPSIRRTFPLMAALGLLAPAVTLHAQSSGADTISAEKLREHVRYLAGDALAGRRTGTPGNTLAAEYIAGKFKEYGLVPLRDLDGYYHRFDYTSGLEMGKKNSLVIAHGTSSRRLAPGDGYNPMGFSDDGEAKGDLVFAGYGITAPEIGYDDYAGIDAEGKIVVLMRYSPDGSNPHGEFARFASFAQKVINAREHGASAILFINPPVDSPAVMKVVLDRNFTNAGIPAAFVVSTLFDDLRDPAGRSLADVQRAIDAARKPASFPMAGYRAELATDIDLKKSSVPNVIGMIPGRDLKLREEFIVIGGHFDHLGDGGEGSLYTGRDAAIHYGADDNASGTAGVLALAERFAARHDNRRTLIFMAFNGEEEGLLGSASLMMHPPFKAENVVAMVNMDMIGRLDSSLIIQGTGTSPWWRQMLPEMNRGRFALKLVDDGYGPSDHSSFYAKGIPVLFFFTGLHQDYHRPSDTWEKVNYAGEARILDFVTEIVGTLDRRDDRPPFTKTQSSMGRSSTGFKVYVGTVPDYGFEGKGLRLSGVADGGPAQRAGLREGDIIVRMGSKPINNIYDYTYALGDFRPKEKVEIEFLRDGKSSTVTVEMGSR